MNVDNNEEFCNKVWEIAKDNIIREVIVDGDHVAWSNNKEPKIEDLDKFVILSDRTSKRNIRPRNVTHEVLRNLKNHQLRLFIYTYSVSITSQHIYNILKRSLIDQEVKNRESVCNIQSMVNLIQILKDEHNFHLEGPEIAWTSWANSIQSAPILHQEQMIKDLPPSHLIHLFKSVPKSEVTNNSTEWSGLIINQNVNVTNNIDFSILKDAYYILKHTVKNAFEDFDKSLSNVERKPASSE